MKYVAIGIATIVLEIAVVVFLYLNIRAKGIEAQKHAVEMNAKFVNYGLKSEDIDLGFDQNLLETQLQLLEKIAASDKSYPRIIGNLATLLPHGLWLTSVRLTPDKIFIEGEAVNQGLIDSFVRSVREADFMAGGKIVSTSNHPEGSGSLLEWQVNGLRVGVVGGK